MADEKYNRKNPAVKRILQEVKEMQANPSDDFMSLPLEENIFEWQFAIRGPADTEFEGGIYHGRIQLPADYPFKPPSFMLLTPNGRFETNTKICLSISNYHPEHWQPSWSVRTALVALIAFMPTSPNGALGSVEYPKEERRALAVKSREAPPKYGSPERQKVIDEIHHYILSKATVVSKPLPLECNQTASTESVAHSQTEPQEAITVVEEPSVVTADTIPDDRIIEEAAEAVNREAYASPTAGALATVEVAAKASGSGEQTMVRRAAQKPVDDRLFTLAAVGLTIAIMVLLLKKFIRSSGYGTGFMDES
ncbi:Ubiquitin-conjugating enzyme E2 32 [Raphanus sativus]|uniref:Ubiquitin-conjugating enzyme E2 32 n=1 Tax=Raphanus sativus TaxID=3726 RepID=A0A6J0JF46_RAPSA|nr:ubiquitin-conjugating enzyme E2 32 [Raphanus sativus]KAJ4886770.1 Ubiquitin-conjugating enzyme E2 32 [Raphanus sativus]